MTLKHWKEAATVILTGFKSHKANVFNYNVIALKRSSRNSFMPGGYVFPGGAVHPSDSDLRWLNLFEKFSISDNNLKKMQILSNLPPILKSSEENCLPRYVSLKITAIRETFEETGILLCRTKENMDKSPDWTSSITFRQLSTWRTRVQQHPSEFLNLCQHFDCYPDICGLKLWSNWLTPKRGNPKRFDTAFYTAALEEIPTSNADETEVEKLAWFSPKDLATLCKDNEIWLPPPQFYETLRLLKFKNLEDLVEFSSERECLGCEQWMPERVTTSDGVVSLLPGDEQYPEQDLSTGGEGQHLKITMLEYRKQSKVLHRIEQVNDHEGIIITHNYKPSFGHILPETD